MTDFEFGIVVLLVILIIYMLYRYYKSYHSICKSRCAPCGSYNNLPYATQSRPAAPADSESEWFGPGGYQEYTKSMGLDDSTVASHKEYVKDAQLVPGTATRLTTTDHDMNSNWRGLFRPQRVAVSSGFAMQDSNNVDDYVPGTKRAWAPEAEF